MNQNTKRQFSFEHCLFKKYNKNSNKLKKTNLMNLVKLFVFVFCVRQKLRAMKLQFSKRSFTVGKGTRDGGREREEK